MPELAQDLRALILTGGWIPCMALLLGCLAISYSRWRYGRHAATFIFPAAVAALLWWMTGRIGLGLAAAFLWFLIPFARFWFSLSRLRVPRKRALHDLVASGREFDPLHDEARGWEALGFEPLEDREVDPPEPRQVFRFMRSADHRFFVAVCWISEGPFTIVYSAISSWDDEGTRWMSWNYPFPYGLRPPPEVRLWKCPTAFAPATLFSQHEEFLALNEAEALPKPDLSAAGAFAGGWLGWMQRQMDYNLEIGWLRPADDEGRVSYSVRGILGASTQLFRVIFNMGF